jgi:hypothetical protein
MQVPVAYRFLNDNWNKHYPEREAGMAIGIDE